ncbi:saccharopine dehydrogenase [Bacillus sp. CLL-7-23]|uniref:Saccharopine dehydrogenase n=1 Tax=Bacillus changyiensis TaxID=3004103 RepID=A0ABT4X2N9_9BACI|nr:saccharopine dehydrogenase [Bacillus changyiensis]MDA7026367.1 saccharopine dehydrogenase [Bacillus changyiensis]
MIKDQIVVIGGYGHVGGQICQMLGETYPGYIYAAGRNINRAVRFCQETGGNVKPLNLSADWSWLEKTKLVIICIDQNSTALAAACLANGTHYIDISANGSFLNQLKNLNGGLCLGTGIISVGLAPGLTNLLAQEVRKAFDEMSHIDISIMLGLGDTHGKAAIEWTVDHLNTMFTVNENSQNKQVRSFTDGRLVDFGDRLDRRRAYRFPFSDQMTLPHTLGVPSVATRLCFDSKWVTTGLHGLQKIGAMRLLKYPVMRAGLVKMLGSLKMGSSEYAVKVDGNGTKAGRYEEVGVSLYGENESLMTARVAFTVANALYRGHFPNGVFHIDECFELKRVDQSLYLKRKETGEQFVV